MSLAAEHAPKSTATSSSAPPANMPAVLNREPSQQDLEIARQLQSFQSQAIPSHEAPRTEANPQHTPKSMSEIPSESKPQTQPDDQSRNSQQPSPSPYPPAAQFTPLQQQQPQQRTPQSSSASGGGNGQICSNCGTTKTPLWRRSPTGAVICNACGLYYKARNQMRPVGLKRGAAATSYPSDNTQERASSPKAIQGGATYVAADQTNDGTCPGGGRCNGTGGHDGCSGCPAYNNRISKTAQVALRQTSHDPNSQTQGEGSTQGQAGGAQQSVMIACQNCGTTITPLWRRDELGNTICNACGLYHKLHGHHRPVQMKKAEIKRRKRVVPNNMVNDDQSSVYTADTAEDERRSIPPHNEAPSPTSFSNHTESKVQIRLAGLPVPVDFTDTFRAQRLTPNNNSESSRPSPQNPRKRSFSAAAGEEGENDAKGPYPHAQNMVSPNNNDNIDPSLPARNPEPSTEPSRQAGNNATNSNSDKDARRAALEAESEKMLLMLKENQRKLEALRNEE